MRELNVIETSKVNGAGPITFILGWLVGMAMDWGYHHPKEEGALSERGDSAMSQFYANHPMAK